MVKKINFILPSDNSMASIYVRGLCLEDYEPKGWKFRFIKPNPLKYKTAFFSRFVNFINYLYQIIKIKNNFKNENSLYFIKPSSVALLFISRFILRFKIFIDINDPLHLIEHLGRFSKIKFLMMLKITNGIVFESEEYSRYTSSWHKKPYAIIEDTPQFEISFINFNERMKSVVWFGSPATSMILEDYINYFKEFNNYGFSITLLGADRRIEALFDKMQIKYDSINKYDHELLLNKLSCSVLSFVPMPNNESYTLRGNLKAKFGMAAGCITIASDIGMHNRIIEDKNNGFIFYDIKSFQTILEGITNSQDLKINDIGCKANQYVVNNFNRKLHAEKICKFIGANNKQI